MDATPEKKFVNIEVDAELRDVTFFKSFLRNITRVLWSIPCFGLIILGINILLISDKDRRIGDYIAGTRVVKKGNSSIGSYKKSSYYDLEFLR